MSPLLSLSRLIDRMNERVGRVFYWLILVTVVISATAERVFPFPMSFPVRVTVTGPDEKFVPETP